MKSFLGILVTVILALVIKQSCGGAGGPKDYRQRQPEPKTKVSFSDDAGITARNEVIGSPRRANPGGIEGEFGALVKGTFYEGLDSSALVQFGVIEGLNIKWLDASQRWISSYVEIGPEATAEDWLRISEAGLKEMKNILASLEAEVAVMPECEYREIIEEENIRLKAYGLSIYSGLSNALLDLDPVAEEKWLAENLKLEEQLNAFAFLVMSKWNEACKVQPRLGLLMSGEEIGPAGWDKPFQDNE